jgi:hypothetical protein
VDKEIRNNMNSKNKNPNMKKSIFLLILCIVFSFSVRSQADLSGIIVDDVMVEKIECFSFNEMDLVFPYDKSKWNKYQAIRVRLWWGPFTWVPYLECYQDFTREKASEYFGEGKYGVWKFMKSKKKDEFLMGGIKTRKDFATAKEKTIYFEVLGYVQTGMSISGTPTYAPPVTLYKSKSVEIIKSKFDPDAQCSIQGTKMNITIKPSGGYDESFGIIKEGGTTNNEVNAKSTQTTNSNTSTDTKNPNSNLSKDASSLLPFDKKKPGYYEAKDGDFISDQGYKIKGKLEGEYRSYSGGKLEYIFIFKNDSKEGPAAEYWENGKVKAQGTYKNDKKDGEWKRFTEVGKPAGIDVYVDGEKQ